MRRHRLLQLLLSLVLPATLPAFGSNAVGCVDVDEIDARAVCWLRGAETRADRLRIVSDGVESDPQTALAALTLVEADPPAATPGEQAWLFELRALALQALGRTAESAMVWEAALQADDGSERLDWIEPGTWSVPLDIGDGRLLRAARGLAAAGQQQRARDVATQALRLGDRSEALEIWHANGGEGRPVAAATTFVAPPWLDRLPAIELPMYGGKTFSFEASRGKVLIIDFWASWCGPCVKELPFLDELKREFDTAGLEVVALNYQEPPDAAMAFVQTLGLTMPIAIATKEAADFFEVTAMPTVVIADRDGGVRARWSGYEDDVRRQIRDVVTMLLEEDSAQAPPLGEVYEGRDLLEVEWIRAAREPVLGVGLVEVASGERRIAAVLNRSIDMFYGSGHMEERVPVPPGGGRVLSADIDDDETFEVVSYRPGGRKVISFGRGGEGMTWFDAVAPVFAVVPLVRDGETPGRLLLATLDGLIAASRDGEVQLPFGKSGAVSDVVASEKGPWVLETSGRVQRFDRGGRRRGKVREVGEAWTLVTAPGNAGGYGVTGYGVTASAVGRFLGTAGGQAALALSSEQLVLVDLDRGAVVFRAHVEGGVTGLDAGDIDGDGLDELYLATGMRFAVLRCADCRGRVAAANR